MTIHIVCFFLLKATNLDAKLQQAPPLPKPCAPALHSPVALIEEWPQEIRVRRATHFVAQAVQQTAGPQAASTTGLLPDVQDPELTVGQGI